MRRAAPRLRRAARRRPILGLLLGAASLAFSLGTGNFTSAAAVSAASPPAGHESVLVFGGSGRLGSDIARDLLAGGYRVTVFLRPTSDRSRLQGLDVALIEGNALDETDVKRALESAHFHVVVNALGRSEQDVSFYETTGRLIARWSKASGVSQVILHSSVGVGESRAIYPTSRLGAMSPLLQYKGAAEQDLIASGVTYTIIRNAVLRDLPAGTTDGARLYEDQHKFGPVSREGLARLTRECVDNPTCANRIFHAVDEGMVVR
jgi:uncharacterized protein YbjT (DUF2867 family)